MLADAVLDGGPANIGIESTVLSLADGPALLRPGVIPLPEIEALIGPELWGRIIDADWAGDLRPLRYESWVTLGGDLRSYLGFSISPLLGPHDGADARIDAE